MKKIFFVLFRWLLSKGNTVKAERILRRIANINKKEVQYHIQRAVFIKVMKDMWIRNTSSSVADADP
jgi:hypothetical protein